jgi:hypothetical protein
MQRGLEALRPGERLIQGALAPFREIRGQYNVIYLKHDHMRSLLGRRAQVNLFA